MQYAYLNHKLLPVHEALIPVTDRGFRFGDGVFETIRVHQGIPYRFEWHLQRLATGLRAIHINFDTIQLQALCAGLLKRNKCEQGLLRIQVTRGSSGNGYLPADSTPTFLIETQPLTPVPAGPVSLYLSSYRRIPAACLPVSNKLSQGMNSTLARMEAREHGCFEALQLNTEGIIAECSSSHIFWMKGNTLYTPALDAGVLDGSVRAAILSLYGNVIHETLTDIDTLTSADAVCITNSSWLALPVSTLIQANCLWESTGMANMLREQLEKDINAYSAAHRQYWQIP